MWNTSKDDAIHKKPMSIFHWWRTIIKRTGKSKTIIFIHHWEIQTCITSMRGCKSCKLGKASTFLHENLQTRYRNKNIGILYVHLLFKVLLLLGRSNTESISENWGRFDGQLFQQLIMRDFKTWGQSLGISGLRPQAAIPTAAWTGEYAE